MQGETIARVAANPLLTPLVFGSDGNLVSSTYERDGRRAMFDGGFTRLFCDWDAAGTARFVINAAVWLANRENSGDW